MSEKVKIVRNTQKEKQGEEEGTKRLTKRVCTKFERTRIIAYWGQQIALGATPFTDPGDCTDALIIAEKDLDSGKLGEEIIVRRYLPDGSQEDWLVKDLEQVQI